MPSITVVYDNTGSNDGLQADFGFACVVDTGDEKILFDTGSKGNILLSNLQKAGFNPADIHRVVLSHDHWDHTGGLEDFLKENKDVTVYLPNSFPIDFKLNIKRNGIELKEIDMMRRLNDQVYTTRGMDAEYKNTMFKEISLAVKTDKGIILITGCAHPGLIDIIKDVRAKARDTVYMVMGGFHLGNEDDSDIQKVISDLKSLGVTNVCPCHCSGENAVKQFSDAFGSKMIEGGAGTKIQFTPLQM